MTKKLEKMLSVSRRKKKKKGRKPKKKKLTTKQALATRGLTLARTIGLKKAMEIMCEHIEVQRHKVPAIDLRSDDPAAKFMIEMYSELSRWDDTNLRLYIGTITGEPPKFKDTSSMLGTVKRIFHAIFLDDGATKEDVLRYDSIWKMWPNVRRKKERKMADSKLATRKKTSAKKASRKKAGKKTKRVQKRASKKKVSRKKSGGMRLSPITEDTKIVKKKATCKESEAWNDFLQAIPKKAITFTALCKIIDKKLDGDEQYTRRVLGSLRRRGYVSTVE